MNNKIVIITPFYNPGDFLEKCVASIMSQKYDNYKIIFIDDASTDGSFEKLPPPNEKVVLVRNVVRKTALENLHDAILTHCEPDDIAVFVDGDDWLPNKKVLSFIDEFYKQNDCWIMYGQSSWTDGRRGFASSYTVDEFENLRFSPFKVSHIRSFRAGLYHKIQQQDPTFSCLRDKNGDFYKMTYDVAIMFPIMEMAGFEKTKFNDTVLYTYNRGNPISDDRVNQALQTAIHMEISQKKKFIQIERYK